MIEGNIKVGFAEKKPHQKPTHGGVIRYVGPSSDFEPAYRLYEMQVKGSAISKSGLLTNGMIPDLAPDDVEEVYLYLALGMLFRDSPIVIPDGVKVWVANWFYISAPEIIARILGSNFWMADCRQGVSGELETTFSIITRKKYMAMRARLPRCVIPIDGTERPQFCRQLADGRLEEAVR